MHHLDFFIQLLNLMIFVWDHLLKFLFFRLRQCCIFLFLFRCSQKGHRSNLHLSAKASKFFLFLSNNSSQAEFQLADSCSELRNLDFKMLSHLCFLLDFRVHFLSITINDFFFRLKILCHSCKLILVVFLERFDICISEVCYFDLECFSFFIVSYLLFGD